MARGFRIPDRGIPFKPHQSQDGLIRRGLQGAGPGAKPRVPGTKTGVALDVASNAGGGVMDWVMGGVSMMGLPGMAIATGAAVGTAMENFLPVNTAGSGRGSGRAAFNPPKPEIQPVDLPNTYTVGGVTYDSASGQAINPETGKVNPSGYSIKPEPKAAPAPDNGRDAAPPTQNPNGVEQKGTNTGFKASGFGEANSLLSRMGINSVEYGKFESNNLPGTSDYEAMGGSKEDAGRYYSGEGVETVIDGNYEPIEAKQRQGSPELTQDGATKTTDLVKPAAGLAELGTVERYGDEFMAARPDMPDRYSTSMTGLRAAEASKGLLYASGKYWKANPNAGSEGQKDFVEIQKDEWNQIKRGEDHAQNFLQQKMGPVKSAISLGDEQNEYAINDDSAPTERFKPNAEVDTNIPTNAPSLIEAPSVQYVDKDRTGRYNNFNNR